MWLADVETVDRQRSRKRHVEGISATNVFYDQINHSWCIGVRAVVDQQLWLESLKQCEISDPHGKQGGERADDVCGNLGEYGH